MDYYGFIILLITYGFASGQNGLDPLLPSGTTWPEYLCDWASCLGLCSTSLSADILQIGDIDACADLLPPTAVVSRCAKKSQICVSSTPVDRTNRCKPSRKNTCFSTIQQAGQNYTHVCTGSDCIELIDYCQANDNDCTNMDTPTTAVTELVSTTELTSQTSTTEERPSEIPSTTATAITVTEAGVETMDTNNATQNILVTTHYLTSPPPSQGSFLGFVRSHTFIVGLGVGLLIITPCLICMLIYCLHKRKRKEKHPKQEFGMNDAVYQAIGPELPPNHPSMRTVRSVSMGTAVSGVSYQELDSESRCTDDGVSHQSGQMSPTSLEHHYEMGPEAPHRVRVPIKYRKSTKRTNSLAMINRDAYRNERMGGSLHTRLNNSDSCISKSSGNNHAYVTLESVAGDLDRDENGKGSDFSRPYMALDLAGVDSGKGRHDEKNHSYSSLDIGIHSSSNGALPEADQTCNSPGTNRLDEAESTALPERVPSIKVSPGSLGHSEDTDTTSQDPSDKTAGANEQSPKGAGEDDSAPRRTMTFPRRRGHSTDELDRRGPRENDGAPSKSKFRSLRFVSRKSRRAKKWKKASDGDLCLDLNICSPTTPEEDDGQSFFTAAIPIVQLKTDPEPIKADVPVGNGIEGGGGEGVDQPSSDDAVSKTDENVPSVEVPDTVSSSSDGVDPAKLKLPLSAAYETRIDDPNTLRPPLEFSKSQEDLLDDPDEPFRSRSCSQPTRQTYSPSLSKEYNEIKESWGANCLQTFKIEEED